MRFPLLIAGLMVASPAQAAYDILFYAQNGCRGPVIFRHSSASTLVESCKAARPICKNDEARSVKILGTAHRPKEIALFDDPAGKTGDDWVTIQMRPLKPGMARRDQCIATFEQSVAFLDGSAMQYHRKNGLDGKVSFVRLRW